MSTRILEDPARHTAKVLRELADRIDRDGLRNASIRARHFRLTKTGRRFTRIDAVVDVPRPKR